MASRKSKGSWKKGLISLLIFLFVGSYWLVALSYTKTHGLPAGSEYTFMYSWDFFFTYWKVVAYFIHGMINK